LGASGGANKNKNVASKKEWSRGSILRAGDDKRKEEGDKKELTGIFGDISERVI